MADPADDPELDATPVPSAIDVRRSLTFSSGPDEEPLAETPAAAVPAVSAEEAVAVTQMRGFVDDCKECLRTPSRQDEFTAAIQRR
eukprot:gene23209-28087_t